MADALISLQIDSFELLRKETDRVRSVFNDLSTVGAKAAKALKGISSAKQSLGSAGGDVGGSGRKETARAAVGATPVIVMNWPAVFTGIAVQKTSQRTQGPIEKTADTARSWGRKITGQYVIKKGGSILDAKAPLWSKMLKLIGLVTAGGAVDTLAKSGGTTGGLTAAGGAGKGARQKSVGLPVIVTNWPAAFSGSAAGKGAAMKSGPLEAMGKKAGSLLEKSVEKWIVKKAASWIDEKAAPWLGKKSRGAATWLRGKTGGALPWIGKKIPSFLSKSSLLRIAGLGRAGAALAGTVGSAGAATTAGAVLSAGAAGYGLGTLLNKGLGWVSGKATGGKHEGEGWLGSMLFDLFHRDDADKNKRLETMYGQLYAAREEGDKAREREIMNNIQLTLKIDENGRATLESKDMKNKAALKRGKLRPSGERHE